MFLFGNSPLFFAKSSFFFRSGEGGQYKNIYDIPENFE